MMKKRIAVVVHELDVPLEPHHYLILLLMAEWKSLGYDVRVVRGTSRFVPADVAISHVDLTRVPDEYLDFLSRYPVVVNRNLVDIAKSRVSDAIVRDGDGWDGPVIVKTDLNDGGRRERNLAYMSTPLLQRVISRAIGRPVRRNRKERQLVYPVFPSIGDVPDGMRQDPTLVTERFVPEEVKGGYLLRMLFCLGSRTVCVRSAADHPFVKGANTLESEIEDCSAAVIDVARARGVDYGKVDYVMRDGRPVIFDVNRTPTYSASVPTERHWNVARLIAPGIADYFR